MSEHNDKLSNNQNDGNQKDDNQNSSVQGSGNEAEEFMIKMVIKIVGFVAVTAVITVGAAMYLI